MGKRFYNLNLSPINRHRGPGHLSSSSTGGSGWWQRRWKLSGPYLCRHLARLHQPQRQSSSLLHLARIPLQGMRMWVTPDRCESCLGRWLLRGREH